MEKEILEIRKIRKPDAIYRQIVYVDGSVKEERTSDLVITEAEELPTLTEEM